MLIWKMGVFTGPKVTEDTTGAPPSPPEHTPSPRLLIGFRNCSSRNGQEVIIPPLLGSEPRVNRVINTESRNPTSLHQVRMATLQCSLQDQTKDRLPAATALPPPLSSLFPSISESFPLENFLNKSLEQEPLAQALLLGKMT